MYIFNKRYLIYILFRKNKLCFCLKVLFGGGRGFLLPNTIQDYDSNSTGKRIDGRHLINDWITGMDNKKNKYRFVWNANDFRNLDPNQYDYVLGN